MDGGIVWSLDHASLKHLEEHLLLISGRRPPPLQALQPHPLPRPFRPLIIHSPPPSPPQVTRLSYEGSYSPSFFSFSSLSSTRSPTFIFYLCRHRLLHFSSPNHSKVVKTREREKSQKKKDTCSCLLAESLVHRRGNPQIRPSRRLATSLQPLLHLYLRLSQLLLLHPRNLNANERHLLARQPKNKIPLLVLGIENVRRLPHPPRLFSSSSKKTSLQIAGKARERSLSI